MAAEWEGSKAAMRDDIPTESPIGDELAGIHAAIDRLEHQSSRLHAKLQPILRQIPESPEAEMKAVHETGAAITEGLRQARERLNSVTESLIRTLDRLDV